MHACIIHQYWQGSLSIMEIRSCCAFFSSSCQGGHRPADEHDWQEVDGASDGACFIRRFSRAAGAFLQTRMVFRNGWHNAFIFPLLQFVSEESLVEICVL